MTANREGPEQKPDSVGLPDDAAAEPQKMGALTEPEASAAGAEALASALKGSFTVLKVVIILMIAFIVVNAIFHVAPQEVKFKLRFGRVVPSWGEWALQPGTVHIQWPWEEVFTVSTEEKSLPVETEFWTNYFGGIAPSKKTSLRVQEDGYLITGDVNIVHMKMRARYRVRGDARGALSHLFGVQDPEAVFKRMLLASTVRVVGSMKVMDVLRGQDLFDRIKAELVARVAAFEEKAGVPLGIEVVAVEATGIAGTEAQKNPTEPRAVSDAFTEAQNASSLRQQLMDEGRLEANALAEDAKAMAQETRAAALGDKEYLVRAAQADAGSMAKLLPVYHRSAAEADILRETFFQRALDTTLGAAQTIFVLYDNPDREVRYMLSAEPPPLTKEAAPQE